MKNNFNLFVEKVLNRLEEDCSAGGAMSVFGNTAAASPHIGDYAIDYAPNDMRTPKGGKKKAIIRRNPTELTVFATGVSKPKGKNKKSGKQK